MNAFLEFLLSYFIVAVVCGIALLIIYRIESNDKEIEVELDEDWDKCFGDLTPEPEHETELVLCPDGSWELRCRCDSYTCRKGLLPSISSN